MRLKDIKSACLFVHAYQIKAMQSHSRSALQTAGAGLVRNGTWLGEVPERNESYDTRPGKLTLCDIEAMAIEIFELPIKNGDVH
jgi:hypothetical protein